MSDIPDGADYQVAMMAIAWEIARGSAMFLGEKGHVKVAEMFLEVYKSLYEGMGRVEKG